MKKLLTLLLLTPLLALAQTPPNFIPRVNGGGTNTYLTNSALIGTIRLDIPPVLPTASGNLQFLLRLSGDSNLLSSSLLILDSTTGALIGNGAGLTNIPGLNPWTSDVDSAGYSLTNSTSSFSIVDSNGVARLTLSVQTDATGETKMADASGVTRLQFDQDGTGIGGSYLKDANGETRLNFTSDGTGAGITYMPDANGSQRLTFSNNGNDVGVGILRDATGEDRVVFNRDDEDGSGDTALLDGLGNDRFSARLNADDSSGATYMADGLGNYRFKAEQNGSGSGLTTLYDALGNIRFNAEQDGAGNGDTALHDAAGDVQLSVNTTGTHGNGAGLTNILEKNVVVTTNTWGQAVINFALGTQVQTNCAGNITLTGISGFVTTNLNWQTIDINPNGGDRVITVPADWWVSGFTAATTVTVPTAGWAKLRIEALIGRSTNASIEIYQ